MYGECDLLFQEERLNQLYVGHSKPSVTMKMPIFFLMIVVVGTTVDMMHAQEISYFKLGSEKCSTKCKRGYLKIFDSCSFNFDVSFKETLPDLSSLHFELMEASSNIYTHLLTLDMKSDCEGYKENADVYCTEINMNVFSITIKANELSRYSEAKIRAYIKAPNKPNVVSGVQEFPKFYDTTDASGQLKINGIHMATGSNCNTTIAGKYLTIEFQCISQAKPCMIQLIINENVELQEEENHIAYEHIFESSQEVNVTIQFSACILEHFYNNMSCTIKTDENVIDDNNNNKIIAIVASTISIIVIISVGVILFICW
ncbi:unnamed protein product [Lymnaea stagnalis]|uniref:Uncharacterized protein n=1 Tax=Lymnaea stagnalis TaxID=6523 RepID=A0AAV2I497_LYMST